MKTIQKTNMVAVLLALSVQSQAAITTIIDMPLGEVGSTGADNLALDVSGNGYHMNAKKGGGGLEIGTASPAAPGSTAYTSFDGTAAMSTTLWKDSAATVNLPTNNFALEMWVRQDDTAGWQRYLRSGSANTIAFSNRTTTNKANFQLNGVAGSSIDSPNALNTGQWYHLAMVRNSGVSTVYLDGAAVAGSFSQAPAWLGNFALGQKADSDGSQRFKGDMDELRLFTFEAGDDPLAALSVNIAVAPEPSSVLLCGLGGLALGLRRRR